MAEHVEHPSSSSHWRFARTPKWVRARRGGRTIADSRRVLLVWEPGMPFPWYAFPLADVTVDGTPLEDPDLSGHVLLRFADADEWLEEEEPLVGHPRDPFHRVDARRSSRHVRVSVGGTVIADSRRPTLVFETNLPVRAYFRPEEVRTDLLEPSPTRTACAYKGHASHLSLPGARDIAWTYPEPLPDAPPIARLIAFYDERVDVEVDGERRARPRTVWSEAAPADVV